MIIRNDLLIRFALHVHTICYQFNGSVISWHRTVKHNRDVGGHPDSLHRLSLACDIEFDTPDDQSRAHRYADRSGLWYEPKRTATHFQALPPKTPDHAP